LLTDIKQRNMLNGWVYINGITRVEGEIEVFKDEI
jgi:hypothetical protein